MIMACMTAMAQMPELKFNSDGEFKIAHFTDLHYKNGNKKSLVVNELISEVLETEKPDLILITGDLFYSKNVAKMMPQVMKEILDSGVPFGIMEGNHDAQFEATWQEIYDMFQALPGSVMPPRNERENPNYVVEIMDDADNSVGAVLYCIDSNRYSQVKGIGKYAWLTDWQVRWYRDLSASYTRNNGGGPVPSLMFFHIPLPEFQYVMDEGKQKVIGTMQEKVCCPYINTGMFAAAVECGDVLGIFCGHDHNNDYAVAYYNILLAYGRYSGGNTVYNDLGANGARIIKLKKGERKFDTYIHLRGNEIINEATFPDSFLTPKELKSFRR